MSTTTTLVRHTPSPLAAAGRRLSTASSGSKSPLARRRLPLRSLLLPISRRSTTLPLDHSRNLPDVWFNASFPLYSVGGKNEKPDGRTVKLGKTLRILQERLPTLLQSPLPSEILSPNISLHLFPSTHPHLPVVSGRVAYIAALWTSPIAWNRVPIVGNVRLEILSERMAKQSSFHAAPSRLGAGDEKLVVRWRTIGRSAGMFGGVSFFGGSDNQDSEFTGLFIFEFDRDGRVLSHTIEHVQEGGEWERGVGARFVGLTDWLLGGMRGAGGGGRDGSGDTPMPAYEMPDNSKMR